MDRCDVEMEDISLGIDEDLTEEDKTLLIQQLRAEISELKDQLRLTSTFGCGCASGVESGPVAHVVYFNNLESMASRYRVEELLENLANSSCDSQMQVEAVTQYHQPSALLLNGARNQKGGCEEVEGEEVEGEEVCVVGSVEYYNGFCLDWRGVPVREVTGEEGRVVEWKANEDTAILYPITHHVEKVKRGASRDGPALLEAGVSSMPSTEEYAQVYREPFWVDIVQQREEKRLRKMGIVCFNCGEDHHLKDCPEPKNPSRIQARRQEYMASLGTPGADKRYHMNSPDDRFQKFVPGKISAKLRKALGLINDSDYPPYIYRMRELKYPPGYRLLQLEETLDIYDDASDVMMAGHEHQGREDIIYPGFNSSDVAPAPPVKLGCGLPPPTSDTKHGAGETTPTAPKVTQNTEKLKEWLEFEPSTTKEQDMDDLGTLSDYEFDEGEMTEDGEEVMGFGLRKLLKSTPKTPDNSQRTASTADEPPPRPKKAFSLDFPPGMVHDESECETSPKRWNEIKKILEERLPVKTTPKSTK